MYFKSCITKTLKPLSDSDSKMTKIMLWNFSIAYYDSNPTEKTASDVKKQASAWGTSFTILAMLKWCIKSTPPLWFKRLKLSLKNVGNAVFNF